MSCVVMIPVDKEVVFSDSFTVINPQARVGSEDCVAHIEAWGPGSVHGCGHGGVGPESA